MFNSKKERLSRIDDGPITTVIGPEVTIKGEVHGDGTIKIDGKVFGNIFMGKGVVLGEKSCVNGNVEGGAVIVHGKVDGNITCRELTIKKSGVINGDISTHLLQVELGGRYSGKLTTNSSERSETKGERNGKIPHRGPDDSSRKTDPNEKGNRT